MTEENFLKFRDNVIKCTPKITWLTTYPDKFIGVMTAIPALRITIEKAVLEKWKWTVKAEILLNYLADADLSSRNAIEDEDEDEDDKEWRPFRNLSGEVSSALHSIRRDAIEIIETLRNAGIVGSRS